LLTLSVVVVVVVVVVGVVVVAVGVVVPPTGSWSGVVGRVRGLWFARGFALFVVFFPIGRWGFEAVDASLGSDCLQGSKNITNSELVGAQVIVVERFPGESFGNVGWVATKFKEGSDSAVKLGDKDFTHPRVFADVLDEPLVDFAFVE